MPADYVNKLARMFQDIKVSEDLNQEFKEAHRNNNEGIAGGYHTLHKTTTLSPFVGITLQKLPHEGIIELSWLQLFSLKKQHLTNDHGNGGLTWCSFLIL